MVKPPNKHVNTIHKESKNGETILFWHGVNVLLWFELYDGKWSCGFCIYKKGGRGGKE